jgi:hypothetical protein
MQRILTLFKFKQVEMFVDDTSPQLGGNLDTNNQQIITVSNRDLDLYPNGTGAVEIGGNTNPGTLF